MVTIQSVAFTVDSVIVVTGSLAIACCHIRVTCSVLARKRVRLFVFPSLTTYIPSCISSSFLIFVLVLYLFCSNPLGLSPDVRCEIKQNLFLFWMIVWDLNENVHVFFF